MSSWAPQDERLVRTQVREFILSAIKVSDLQDGDDLFESGLVNSLFAVQLMTFLEKAFGIEVKVADLDFANFRSIDASATFVIRQSRASTG